MKRTLLAVLVLATSVMLASSPRVDAAPIVSIGSATVTVGDTFTIPVSITDAVDLNSFQFDLSFDALILQVSAIGVTESGFFTQGDITVFNPGFSISGQIVGVSDALILQAPVNGSGVLANIEFTAISSGISALTLSNAFLNLSDIGFTVANGEVCVTSPTAPTCAPGGGGGQVPEPTTVALLATGLAVLSWRRRCTCAS